MMKHYTFFIELKQIDNKSNYSNNDSNNNNDDNNDSANASKGLWRLLWFKELVSGHLGFSCC